MQVKRTLSVALFLTVLLLGQAMTGHLNQIPGIEQDSTLESISVVMASNSTNDTDGDGIDDAYDDCPNGDTNWTSTATTDWDADGCQDSMEDTDDDNDGVSDNYDSCPKGLLGWTSYSGNDYDSDGCKDSNEDYDDDNDWVFDADDSCPKGELGWTSTNSTDADSDGCRDSTEDSDGGASSGNNSGNNTGGNNTGGNNTGGNNSGSNNDSHCLTVDNVSVDTTYVATLDLVNICNHALNYPGVNASANHPGVSGFYNGTEWYYLIGSYGTYNMSWQLSFDQSVVNGSYITLYFEATILNCGGSDSYHDCPNSNDSTLTHQFLFISNNENSGNNTGGNNTGGNNTDGNNTGGNNTGGNNTGGNNTDGNNTDGNNTDGNNTGNASNPCGNPSPLTFSNTSSAYAVNQSVTFILTIDCDEGDVPFAIFGTIDSALQGSFMVDWGIPGICDYCWNFVQSGQSQTYTHYLNWDSNDSMYNITLTLISGQEGIQGEYIVEASLALEDNLSSNITWNFTVYGDNDADGVSDATDNCPNGTSNWTSTTVTDYDSDGCQDSSEDTDDDNDGVSDVSDSCMKGDLGWTSSTSTDYDGDGCKDSMEDLDDDADGISDTNDNCPLVANADQADLDGDGIGSQCDESEVSIDEDSDCVFSDVNYEPTTEVIFYLSWTDSDGVEHCGTLQFELYSAEAPIHVQNFQDHVEAGNYNGTVYHRIIDGFMIQSGDFEYGNGMGGYAYSWHGYCSGQQMNQVDCDENQYSIPDESNSNYVHAPGALSMAKTSQANTGGSQFFIVDAGSIPSHLDGVHTIFGQAIAGTIDGVEVTGIEVVDAISQVEVEGAQGSSPTHDVTIIGAENIVSTQSTDNGTIEEEQVPIPSIGMVGTAVAISAGFFIAIRREDEE